MFDLGRLIFGGVELDKGSVLPNFFAKQKIAGAHHLAKKIAVQFHQQLKLQIWSLNWCSFAKFVCRLPKKVEKSSRKSRTAFVDEIDPKCQFHQHFTRKFFVRKCFSLVMFWRKKHFRTKKAPVKC